MRSKLGKEKNRKKKYDVGQKNENREIKREKKIKKKHRDGIDLRTGSKVMIHRTIWCTPLVERVVTTSTLVTCCGNVNGTVCCTPLRRTPTVVNALSATYVATHSNLATHNREVTSTTLIPYERLVVVLTTAMTLRVKREGSGGSSAQFVSSIINPCVCVCVVLSVWTRLTRPT